MKLICAFVFASAKIQSSHDMAHICINVRKFSFKKDKTAFTWPFDFSALIFFYNNSFTINLPLLISEEYPVATISGGVDRNIYQVAQFE